MAGTTTRDQRASRWRTMRILATATVAISALQLLAAADLLAQVKAPAKQQLRGPAKAAPKADANDTNADKLNEKWLSEHQQGIQTPAPKAEAANVPSDDERFSSIPRWRRRPAMARARWSATR